MSPIRPNTHHLSVSPVEVIKGRNYGLDYLRISLALLIFLFHSRIHILCDYGFLNSFIREGNLAMTGFFMLSGFSLIISYHNKILKEREDLIQFYKRRFVSIYPLYIVTGTLFVFMMVIGGYQSIFDNIVLMPIELFGFQSIFENALSAYAHNGGTWFISCLMPCYIGFPIIKMLFDVKSRRHMFITLLISIFLTVSIPFVGYYFTEKSMYTSMFYRLMEFLTGCLIACYCISENLTYIKKWKKVVVIIFILAMMVFGISYFHEKKIPNEWFVVICFTLIFFLLGSDELSTKKKTGILYLSKVSYAFFLAQFFIWNPMKLILLHFPFIPNLAKIIVPFVACLALSVALHEVIEVRCGEKIKRIVKL